MRRTEIINELIARGYKAEARENIKNGVLYEGIVIRSDDTIAPVIYTQRLIEDAETQGKSLADVVADVIRIYEENKYMKFNVEQLFEREFILNHVYIAVQKESDEDLVKKGCEYEGIEAYLYVRGDHAGERTYSVKVNRRYLESAQMSVEEAWKRAEENTFSETRIQSMVQVMAELCGIPYDPSMEMDVPIYVISNELKVKGAGAILDKTNLAEFVKAHGVNQLIVLPSSVHEMIIVPYDPEQMDIEEMSEMVRQINATEVAPEDRLTDRAYLIEV